MSLDNMELDIMEVLNSATSEILDGHSDWSSNMQIVDHLNGHPENAPKILEIVKKRVAHKKNEIALSSLALLEALVKNCPCVHPFVADRAFLEALVKSLPKRVREPTSKSLFKLDHNTDDMIGMERIDRTLVILQSWGLAFANSNSYPIFSEIYRGLQKNGVKFPEPDKNETAPVFTPAKRPSASSSSSASASSSSAALSKSSSSKAASATPSSSRASKTSPAKSSAASNSTANGSSSSSTTSPSPSSASAVAAGSAHVKFKDSECQVAWDSTTLLLEMASAAASVHELQNNEIVTELLRTVQRLQRNVTSRLSAESTLNKEWLMSELLCTNEAILSGLAYLQQLVQGKIKVGTKPPALTPPANANVDAATNKASDSKPQKKAETNTAPPAAAASAPAAASPAATVAPAATAKPMDTFDFFSGSLASSSSSAQPQPQPQMQRQSSSAALPNSSPARSSTPSNSTAAKALLPPPPSGGEAKRRSKKDGGDTTPPKAPVQPAPAPAIDPLDLLFSNPSSSASSSSATPASATSSAASSQPFDLFSVFGLPPPADAPAVAAPSKPKDDDDPFLALAARK